MDGTFLPDRCGFFTLIIATLQFIWSVNPLIGG
jgi:hypothetical protein